MKEKIAVIETKVEALLERYDKLNKANKSISTENSELKSEVNQLKRHLRDTKLGSGDTNEAVKRKLTSVLDRLEELESMFN